MRTAAAPSASVPVDALSAIGSGTHVSLNAAGTTSPGIGPVVGYTRREEVTARIRHALLAGQLKPGQRVKEVALAEALGVSRPTLRESLQQLVHEGALVQVPHKGIHVADPTPEELLQVAEVRLALETLAATTLSKDPHGRAMQAVRRALEEHLAAIEAGDHVATDVTHLELHRRIWEGAGNAMLSKIWPLIASQVHIALTLDQATLSNPARDAQLHRRLVEVIESGDLAAIATEVEEHIMRSVDQVISARQTPATPQQGLTPTDSSSDEG